MTYAATSRRSGPPSEAIVAVMAIALLVVVRHTIAAAPPPPTAPPPQDPSEKFFLDRFDVRIFAGNAPPAADERITFRQLAGADLATLRVYLRLFQEEFAK